MSDTDGPEGGADKFRDNWVPTPFITKVFDADSKTYMMEFELPKQLLLINPNWQAMVHDEVLRYASKDGIILEGQIVITEREGGYRPYPKDPTVDRDASTQEVLKNPAKEAEVEEQQRAMDSMSEAEIAFRKRMRQNMRETEQTAFGFVSDQIEGRPLPEGRRMRLDRNAFMEGFFGGEGPAQPLGRDTMIVKAEALVASFLDLPESDSMLSVQDTPVGLREDTPETESYLDKMVSEVDIPDDLSGLDDL